MKPSLIDTDILSYFFRGNKNVITSFKTYLTQYSQINFCIITYYEILSGLKYRDARKRYDSFLEFSGKSNILPLTKSSVAISSEIYAELRKKGTPVDDIDLLIAGIAIQNGMTLITHNRRHFDRIEALEIEDWSLTPLPAD